MWTQEDLDVKLIDIKKKKKQLLILQNQKKIIKKYTTKKSHILLVGDFSAKVGNNLEGITGGDIFCKCRRFNTKNEKEQSIIDYAIVLEKEIQGVEKVIIEVEELFKIRGKSKTDHNTFIIKLKKT